MPFSRHIRFFVAAAAGSAAGVLACAVPLSDATRVLIGAVVFFVAYLGLMARLVWTLTPDILRRHAERSDEGLPLILALALASVVASLTAILLILNTPQGGGVLETVLALATVPLGWAMLHTVAAFHYAYLYYTPVGEGGDAKGLVFPATAEPGIADFLYFSFVVGMTAQVSDVVIENTRTRATVLAHSVVAFFYNTGILALTVNAALSMGG